VSAVAVPIVPVVDEGLGNSSYVVALGDGRALVVDPARDPRPYLAAAERIGVTISHTAETHLHADFVTGSRELAARGAAVLAPAGGGIEWPHRGLADGDETDLGGLRLRALATPGHTPEHLAYLLLDGEVPVALFSGGSLLAGSVARTDLIGPDQTEPLARSLWRSLAQKILVLPDGLAVYPTHGAGSFCSAPAGGERTTTIGKEKASNPLLAAPDEDTFVNRLLQGFGSYPPYFRELRAVNRRGPRVYGSFPDLDRLGVAEVRRLATEGAAVVDVRPFEAFGAGHIPGSVSIELRPQFASWLGWLLPRDRALVLIAGKGTDRSELVRQCLTIGYEDLAGELDGGVAAWERAGPPLEGIPLLPAQQVEGQVLDVRQHSEYAEGHLPTATHRELGDLRDNTGGLPAGPVTVMCGHGQRAMTGASMLRAAGRRDLTVALGGPADWAAAHGRALVTGR
jgi:hydroxyacylglutathione hydrolase